MSRVGNAPIVLPQGVQVNIDGQRVEVTGPKGQLETITRPEVKLEVKDGNLVVSRQKDDRISRSLHGLYRSSIANMVKGVTEGWEKKLEMVGVGYRAAGGGNSLTLSVGFSHPVTIDAPEGITFAISENTKIAVSGIDKILVGQVAANVRAIKPPEVYKGKGIRYAGEYVRRKPGKAGKTVGAK